MLFCLYLHLYTINYNMRKLIITLIFFTSVLSAFPIYFKHIGMKDGLSQLSVMSIYQDELGRMWFGTLEGLSMYDGEHTESFKPSEGGIDTPDSPAIRMGNENYPITGDTCGNIYFRSDYALLRYNMRQQKFSCLKEQNVSTIHSHNNLIWVATSDSVYTWSPQSENFEFVLKLNKPNSNIHALFIDSKEQLWIGTANTLYRIDNSNQPVPVISSENINSIEEDSQGNLWIATRTSGVYKLDKSGTPTKFVHNPLNPNSLSNNQVRSFAEDNSGNIWIGTFTGLNKYNPKTNQFTVYLKDALPGSLTHASIFSTYKDHQGTIWVGTYYGGVNYFNPETDIFTYYSENTTRTDCLSYPYVGHFAEDKDGNIWICTEGGGLNFFNRKTKQFTHFLAGSSSNAIAHNNLKSICYSSKYNKLYIGTHTGGLSIYDIATKRFHNPYTENPSYRKKAGDIVNQVALYNDEYLVMLTSKGLLKMELSTEEITPLFKSPRTPNWCGSFLIDSKENIWLAQKGNVVRINIQDENDQITFKKKLGRFEVSKIVEDRDGRIFFGTNGSGIYLYNEKENSFTNYTAEKDALQSNYCYDMIQSVQGYLIISSDKGLTFFDPCRMLVRTINTGTMLPISGINTGCGMLVCNNGEIFVGGIDGATSFFEQDLFASNRNYKLYFSNLYINNDRIYPDGPDKTLSKSLPYTDKLILTHKQNNLTFTFTSNNYANVLKKTVYEYKLEGFDPRWIPTETKNISYTNLNPGAYTLVVREKQYDPNVQLQTIKMDIIIKSPFYATPLSYIIYIIIVAGIIYSFIRFKQSQLLLRTSLEMERKEKEQIEVLNQAKLQFFSNISHEFRTPLTLIISQVELLLQSSSLAPSIYNKILKIYKNSHHMRNLISELLDFRKLEQGHVTLQVSEHNLTPFIKEIYLSFYEYAASRTISFHYTPSLKEVLCWFDAKQMQKVFFNLLTNAFKYTKTNGSIEIVLEETDKDIVIKVSDTGTGIRKEDISRIFDRFYQVGNDQQNTLKMAGTGIGLSLTKSIIELHHGTIQVESIPNHGSTFIVSLKKGKNHFTEKELVHESSICETEQSYLLSDLIYTEEKLLNTEEPHTETEEKPTYSILIVEDNEELLQILSSLFTPVYHVIIARNGKEGLEKATEEKPDIILSDIMMPEMPGTEMCLKIKNNFDTCHIPVVLLTALNSPEQSIEGLQRGADDYISKPFNANVLVARCYNLVRNRVILQKKFSSQKDFDTQSLASNPIDQKFLDAVHSIIGRNLDNTEFDMNILAKELALSRSSLYAKFKALTGMTPNDFVINYKLKRAATLLASNPDMQIADISEQLGFGSPRYFSRCFKALFNITPVEYRKKEISTDKQQE